MTLLENKWLGFLYEMQQWFEMIVFKWIAFTFMLHKFLYDNVNCIFKMLNASFLRIQKQSPEVFCKKGVHTNFKKFTGKLLCQSLFLNKVAGLGLQLY